MLNSLRLFYPPIVDDVDFPDLCWLQIVRLKSEPLYRWVRSYLNVFAALRNADAMVSDREKKEYADQLQKLMPDDDPSSFASIYRLKEIVPGLENSVVNPSESTVFRSLDSRDLHKLESGRRLGSPTHYRLYFAFARASGTLGDGELQAVLGSASGGRSIVAHLLGLISQPRQQGGTMYELLLDRLVRIPSESLSPATGRGIASGILDTADEAQRKEPERGVFGRRTVWRQAILFFHKVLNLLGADERQSFLVETFRDRLSIGALFGGIVGAELFAHGRVAGSGTSDRSPLLSEIELDEAISVLRGRLLREDRHKIADVPEFLSFLYRWMQSGPGAEMEVREWVAEYILADDAFLDFLEKCRGWVMSDKIYRPLNERDLKHFLDFDLAMKRLGALADDKVRHGIATKAQELIKATQTKGDGFGRDGQS